MVKTPAVPNLRTALILGAFAFAFAFLAAPAAQATSRSPELVIYLTDQTDLAAAAGLLSAKATVVRVEPKLHALRIGLVDGSTIASLIESVALLPGLRRVEHNVPFTSTNVEKFASTSVERAVRASQTPNDPSFSSQSGLSQISAPTAWDYTTGSSSVTVAIVDTGVNGTHQDLTGRVVAGYNEVAGSAISAGANSENNGHGTEVSGIVGATTNNSLGMSGVDWQARLMPIKVLDQDGVGTATELANGIRTAVDTGANVINLSLGSSSSSTAVSDAVAYAISHGVVVVAAAGNEGASSILYPARLTGVIAVGSVNGSDSRSSFSNTGSQLTLVAPGENILTTAGISSGSTSYDSVSGTSVATPFVSAAAALIKARHPGKSVSQITSALTTTAAKVSGMGGASWTDQYGSGRLNLATAVIAQGDYHASYAGQSRYPTLAVGQSFNLQVSFRNAGTSSWFRGTPQRVRLGTSHDRDHVMPFLREDSVSGSASGWISSNRMQLLTDEVKPGEVGTFSFWITIPSGLAPGTYREYVEPVVDGVTWMEDLGVYWDIRVIGQADQYHAAYVSQNRYPTLSAGQSFEFTTSYRNTGSIAWNANTVHLGTSHDQDRTSVFIREGDGPSGWVASNRIRMSPSSVAPGEIGTFTFWMKVPTGLAPGSYTEYFQPVADGFTWMEDAGAYWDVRVVNTADQYRASFVTQSNYPTLLSGQTKTLTIAYLNTGTITWQRGVVNVGLVRPDHSPASSYQLASNWPGADRPARLNEASVAPGETGTFTFDVTDPNLPAGNYRLDVGLVADGISWFPSSTHAYWNVTVH